MSLTPLIDVVFILLLFFMLSTQFINQNVIPLEITKKSNTSGSLTSDSFVVLRLLENNRISINGTVLPIDDAGLSPRLIELFNGDSKVALQYDDDANVQGLTQLLDILNDLSIDENRLIMGW